MPITEALLPMISLVLLPLLTIWILYKLICFVSYGVDRQIRKKRSEER